MKRSEKAIENFKTMNCAQSVLLSYADEFNIEEIAALTIASGFGGGMAMGETCGAVTGAYMVLGMKIQTDGKTLQEIKAESKANVRKFNELFLAKHGSLTCKKLLGMNISTPEGNQKANENHLFDTICVDLVASAAEIVEANF